MVDTAHKPDDASGGNGYVQFSLAWVLSWDQRTRDRILVEKESVSHEPGSLAASVAYAMAHNQPLRLTKVFPDLFFPPTSCSSILAITRRCADSCPVRRRQSTTLNRYS